MFVFMRNALSAGTIVLASSAVQGPALAQTQVADFYKGKTMEMIVPTSPGGDYDLRARLVSRHLGRLIPGNPTIIVKNMPGGLGVAASNYMYNIAPKDGTSLQIIFQNMPILQAVKQRGVQFDVREFGWLGNTTNTPNIINSWHTTGIAKIEDVLEKELIVGAPGTMSTSYIYPIALNQTIGTKFKVVTGYAGGNLVNLAMEKGEVGGRGSNSWGVVEKRPPAMADRQEDSPIGAGRAHTRDRSARRAAVARACEERCRPRIFDVPLGRHGYIARLHDNARRT